MRLNCAVPIRECPRFFSNIYFSTSAHQLFDEFPQRTVFQHSRISAQGCRNGAPESGFRTDSKDDANEALQAFKRLNKNGTKPTRFNLCAALSSCAKTLNLSLGLQIHACMVRCGHEENLFLGSALVDLYAKCGATWEAKAVFNEMVRHDQVSWTSIITGFAQNGSGREAILMFKDMLCSQIKPNCFTYVSVISACTWLEEPFDNCRLLHAHVIKLGFVDNKFVLCSLIDCYSKYGKLDYATLVFDEIVERDTSLFTSMISGYSQNQYNEEALRMFTEMRNWNFNPSNRTLSSVLNACGSLTVLLLGMQVHSLITKMGSQGNVFIITALIDMYAKCGSVSEARKIFDRTVEKNIVSWTSMIMGYAQSGQATDALELFERFLYEGGCMPDHICFTAVLTACNHAGLLDEGIKYFDKMRTDYGLMPEIDQYACLVDLYARNGHLKKAKKLMEEMPYTPNNVMWSSLLSSCKVYGDAELGREAANQLIKMEPNVAASYLTLASLYAEAGLWGEVAEVRKSMLRKRIRKGAGWSWIEVDKKGVHVFSVGDDNHSRTEKIYAELEKMNLEMKEARYTERLELEDAGFE